MADQSINQRLANVQDTVETAAHYMQSYNDIAQEIFSDLGDFKSAMVAVERAGALIAAQNAQIATLHAQVDVLASIRSEIKCEVTQ